ncbi:hypothetical protein LRS74_21795 [Streptomyces sp. LX-29]|uniref:hypothetical protein n=1 Tax=Streptomyces sp. LX-29 TaxID=2900152 RepID=UPI00240DE51F|nr:hypothetical protein [Streptomyces sp. LX-29]WFB09380.1 hypothetical protein LRS74_21795 [Streptomyces sp. LX-29]
MTPLPGSSSPSSSPSAPPSPVPAPPAAPPVPQTPRPIPATSPNTAFRRLRGQLSPAEFAAVVRRAAREIGEQVSCDARYIGRVESGAIRCPNYAYERVFRHMFPGRTLTDLGFAPREAVRGYAARGVAMNGSVRDRAEREDPAHRGMAGVDGAYAVGSAPSPSGFGQDPSYPADSGHPAAAHPRPGPPTDPDIDVYEESDVLRRAFITGGPTAVATTPWGMPGRDGGEEGGDAWPDRPVRGHHRAGEAEAAAVEDAVRHIRLFDDRYGADGLYLRSAQPLRTAYALLDAGAQRQSVSDRLHTGAGELAISVGWLAHDSGRFADARSHYAEALATARVADDRALEAHAFCNIAFLARDVGRPREAVRAAQAAHGAARGLASPRLLSLIALREAGGWAGLADRTACEHALLRAQRLFGRGPSAADPEWMTFYGEAELEGLEAQVWSALGDWRRAAEHARRAVDLQKPHFARNIALFTAELAADLAGSGRPEEAALEARRTQDLLSRVQSSRIRAMLGSAARTLRAYARNATVADFLARYAAAGHPA